MSGAATLSFATIANRLAYATPQQKIRRLSTNISAIERQANALKLPPSLELSRGGVGLPLNDANIYRRGLPRLLTVIDRAGNHADAQAVADRAARLLSELNGLERGTPDRFNRAHAPRPRFEDVRGGYATLFDTCIIRDNYVDDVKWYIRVLLKNQARYAHLASQVDIPWYFIGIIHALEASFNFRGHLHNGDPLNARTVNVPRGRPLIWLPPSDWESSAKDALNVDGFLHLSDWTVERMLYRWESYNGFGSRAHRIHTPYLWSFSNQYTQGKYVRDGVWSATAVSHQCGAALMLKGLMDARAVQAARAL
jgi:lysozyme family protein